MNNRYNGFDFIRKYINKNGDKYKFFFVLIRTDIVWLRYVIRLLLVPVIAGISYEFIRLAGKSENKFINLLSKPGLWMQKITTKEPTDDMIESCN